VNLSPICRLVTRLTPRTELQCNTANRHAQQIERGALRIDWRLLGAAVAWLAIWLLASLVW